MMMSLDLATLGFTKEELQNRVVSQMCDRLLHSIADDEDGDEYAEPTALKLKLEKSIQERIDQAIASLADTVMPHIVTYLEAMTLQGTNRWGEKKGDPLTFKEYLTKKAEEYMTEKVDFQGKKPDYNREGTQTRITHLVHEHLHYTLDSLIKSAVKDANLILAEGIQKTCEIKLKEIAAALKVSVATK